MGQTVESVDRHGVEPIWSKSNVKHVPIRPTWASVVFSHAELKALLVVVHHDRDDLAMQLGIMVVAGMHQARLVVNLGSCSSVAEPTQYPPSKASTKTARLRRIALDETLVIR